jgi:hypothetical protein
MALEVLTQIRGFYMYTRVCLTVATIAAMSTLNAQPRRMTMVGGGTPDRGKCTVEVVVDGAAEVEIRGDTANLRNLSGNPPQWRRFQCTGALPGNPGDFRFAGVDGRGRQQLVRDPRNGGSAVIRIEDPDNGSEGYTFDITWGNGGPPPPPPGRGDGRGFDRPGNSRPDDRGPGADRDWDSFRHDREDAFRRDDWRMHLFSRIREDLDHVQRITFPFGSDQRRIVGAKQELDQLQDMQSHGRYDRRQLDDVIRAVGDVVADNRLASRDRDVLTDDLHRLQDFREHFRDYGIH